MIEVYKTFEEINAQKELILKNEELLIKKGLMSSDPKEIIEAEKRLKNIQNRISSTESQKSVIVDPHFFNASLGYKDKGFNMSYRVLNSISKKVWAIGAIIRTRSNQLKNFVNVPETKYDTGFVIRKKKPYYITDEVKYTKNDLRIVSYLTDFMLNCGKNSSYENDDLDKFFSKIIWNSLTYDQMTFEIVNDKNGYPFKFLATDASTFRIADTYVDDVRYKHHFEKQRLRGYLPSYVQIIDGVVTDEFYPWELCFGVRNPLSDIDNNGYGFSEIEQIVSTITSMLFADQYNTNFFSNGSMPKGMFVVKGNLTPEKMREFRQAWQGIISGVKNSFRIPVVEQETVEWVSMDGATNNDMQFTSWQEYLIKIVTAIYTIDPAEINFPLQGGSDSRTLFDNDNVNRIKNSKDKGLSPLLNFIERNINKYIIGRINPNFEFKFVGYESENGDVREKNLESDIKKLGNYMTINEIREKNGLKSLGELGDNIGSGIWLQIKGQAQMGAQDGGEDYGSEEGEEDYNDEEEQEEDVNEEENNNDVEDANKEQNKLDLANIHTENSNIAN